MKKIAIVLVAMFALIGAEKASAQSWLESLKGIATEVIDEATGGKLTEAAIVGKWEYAAPGVRMGSSDTLSNLAGAAVETTIEGKLATAYEKVGIKAGICHIEFKEDDTFVMTLKSTTTINGTYTYEASTHAITMNMGKMNIPFTGYAYIDGGNFELVFPANKLVQFMTTIGSKISSFSSITSMLQNYDEVYLGFQFKK